MSEQPNRREAFKTFGRATAIGAAQAAIVGIAVHATQAHSSTIDRGAWDRAKLAYECRALLQHAVEKFGYYYEATCDQAEARYEFKDQNDKYLKTADGTGRDELVAARREWERASDAMDEVGGRWLRECITPTEDAGIALLLTPAPDMEAIRFKAKMIEDCELYALLRTPRDCAEVLREDMARIGGLI